MAKSRSDLLQGTLELLILKILSLEPMHGWGISERIQLLSEEVFLVNQGSLYPALQRMKRKEWISSEWRVTENNRRARYYALTPAGEEQLGRERRAWQRSSTAVERILGTA
ncbi:MAG: PadR family transcriptional regulator [Gemmatimonadetes bacterium]|nr:PadR family transcriptional regulator [Gemmatimonadota bacterium]NNM06504.1 PadR family transcriptional regulator [Gemmatimonadota bacterium]